MTKKFWNNCERIGEVATGMVVGGVMWMIVDKLLFQDNEKRREIEELEDILKD